jgi:hypothetical protein
MDEEAQKAGEHVQQTLLDAIIDKVTPYLLESLPPTLKKLNSVVPSCQYEILDGIPKKKKKVYRKAASSL